MSKYVLVEELETYTCGCKRLCNYYDENDLSLCLCYNVKNLEKRATLEKIKKVNSKLIKGLHSYWVKSI